ncbi:MAG: ankyrin repeat domain-containing protein [Myxococcales bacterium]|nr:ankyrin repeat domain-containing protein [Myxococcales bacterium]
MAFADLVRDGKLEAVRAAIDRGAHLDEADGRGWTPLMIACREGRARVARLLIERGAQLDAVGAHGETALGLAMVRCAGIAELLVERGVLGRPLRAPAAGTLLSPGDCDVCARYPDLIDPDDRWSGAPAELAWLEIVDERRASEGKIDFVERALRCPRCGTRYEQYYACEIETAGVTLPDVSQSIRRCAPRDAPPAQAAPPPLDAPAPRVPPSPSDVPAALLGALFVAEDGKLACQIVRGDGADGERAPFLTTVWAGVGGPEVLSPVHTTWRPPTALRSDNARERLGQLQAELGIVGAGNLYSLYVVRRNPAPAGPDDKEWIAALPDSPVAELRLFPEYGSSPYMPDDWDWQDGWWYPYSTFRPATPAEQAAHEARSSR